MQTLTATLVNLACSAARDLTRRREDLRRLQNERTRLKTLEKSSAASSDRDSLLRSGGGNVGGRIAAEEAVATRDLTTQQLVERTEAEMKNQDAVVEEMSTGLTALKGISLAIGDEADLHIVRSWGMVWYHSRLVPFLGPSFHSWALISSFFHRNFLITLKMRSTGGL